MANLEGLTREQLLKRKELLVRKQQLMEQQDQMQGTDISQAENITDPDLGIKEGRLTGMERLTGGFRSPAGLQERRDIQREELGLAPGVALEPKGFNIENLKDFPMDVVDAIAPAFPALGQILSGMAAGVASGTSAVATGGATAPAIPGSVVAAGVAGAAGGEALRQFIGEQLLGFDQGTLGERAGKIAVEGGFALAGEGIALGLNKALRATKGGIIKMANNLLKRGDKFTEIVGQIAPNVDPAITRFSLKSLRAGDKSVFNPKFANPKFLDDFTNDLLFGKTDDIAGHISKIAKTKPGGAEAVKPLYKEFLGLSDDVLDTTIAQGSKINRMSRPKAISDLAKSTVSTTDDIINATGKDLGKARLNLIKQAPNAPVDLTDINSAMIPRLREVGFLDDAGFITVKGQQVPAYSINPSFAAQKTGKAQKQIFEPLIDRFFDKKVITRGTVIQEAAERGLKGGELQRVLASAKDRTVFTPVKNMKYKEFAKKLANIDVQISGKEFDTVGKLSPQLTGYLKGLRDIPLSIAEAVGDKSVPQLTQNYAFLAETLAPLKQAFKQNNTAGVEQFFRSVVNPGTVESKLLQSNTINKLLKSQGVNFLDDLRAFKAVKSLEQFDSITKGKSQQKLIGLMRKAFSNDTSPVLNNIEQSIDPFLPKGLKIVENSRVHTAASALHSDAVSLLRARFIGNAVPIQPLTRPLVGAAIGGTFAGPVGSLAGLTGGFALQNPALFRQLLKLTASQGGKQIASTPAKQVSRGATVGSLQSLKALLSQNE